MYATVTEADAYVSNYYGSTDLLRTSWESLSPEDKQVCLNRAEQVIDQLPLLGVPKIKGKAFPRDPFPEESLEQARIATIELAVQSLDQDAHDRYALRAQGVRSYSLGDLSEHYEPISGSSVRSQAMSIVSTYLSAWLGGGYNICHTRTRT